VGVVFNCLGDWGAKIMAQKEELQPLNLSQMTLDDVDNVPNDVLHEALQSVMRREGTELLNHQSHKSHGSRIGPTEPADILAK
jgi:hypothetical protein